MIVVPIGLGVDRFTAGMQFGISICVNDGDQSDPLGPDQKGQKGWSGWNPYAGLFGKKPGDTGLVTFVHSEPSPLCVDDWHRRDISTDETTPYSGDCQAANELCVTMSGMRGVCVARTVPNSFACEPISSASAQQSLASQCWRPGDLCLLPGGSRGKCTSSLDSDSLGCMSDQVLHLAVDLVGDSVRQYSSKDVHPQMVEALDTFNTETYTIKAIDVDGE